MVAEIFDPLSNHSLLNPCAAASPFRLSIRALRGQYLASYEKPAHCRLHADLSPSHLQFSRRHYSTTRFTSFKHVWLLFLVFLVHQRRLAHTFTFFPELTRVSAVSDTPGIHPISTVSPLTKPEHIVLITLSFHWYNSQRPVTQVDK